MSKEKWIQAHNELVEEYLEDHPSATWTQAYMNTADNASERMADNLADQGDQLRKERKENE